MKRYFQIEKELLVVHFGLLRFRQYVYGQPVTVESDHKPLVGLLDKPIASCTPRIPRLRMQLQRFDFQLVYKPGKDLFIADILTRAPSPHLILDDSTQDCEDQSVGGRPIALRSCNGRGLYALFSAGAPVAGVAGS